jgi:hypothetical protein
VTRKILAVSEILLHNSPAASLMVARSPVRNAPRTSLMLATTRLTLRSISVRDFQREA